MMKNLLVEIKDHLLEVCNSSETAHKSCAILESLHDKYTELLHMADYTPSGFSVFLACCNAMVLAGVVAALCRSTGKASTKAEEDKTTVFDQEVAETSEQEDSKFA